MLCIIKGDLKSLLKIYWKFKKAKKIISKQCLHFVCVNFSLVLYQWIYECVWYFYRIVENVIRLVFYINFLFFEENVLRCWLFSIGCYSIIFLPLNKKKKWIRFNVFYNLSYTNMSKFLLLMKNSQKKRDENTWYIKIWTWW